ncbi:MAG: DUF3256 family protein [Bacteroidaceae bacterium]|nr:DUF3256 family protein [Bacteroidaceae bacterium]
MKHVISFLCVVSLTLCVRVPAQAQTMKEVWVSMPDSVMTLLTRNNRLDCLDYWEAGQEGRVANRLDGEVKILFLSDDSLSVSDTGVSRYEMRLERKNGGVIRNITVRRVVTSGDLTDWTERVYSPEWQLLLTRKKPGETFEKELLKGTRYIE